MRITLYTYAYYIHTYAMHTDVNTGALRVRNTVCTRSLSPCKQVINRSLLAGALADNLISGTRRPPAPRAQLVSVWALASPAPPPHARLVLGVDWEAELFVRLGGEGGGGRE